MSKFLKYVIGGTLIYWVEVFLTATITEISGLWFIYSFMISLVCGMIMLFYFHKHVTFECKKDKNATFAYFILITLFVYTGWFFTSYVVHTIYPTHYLLSIIVSSMPFSLLGYYLNKRFVFE
ncbi:MAG: GtrA family protein [Candidatus Woesearchaeota archaeon]